MTLQGISPASVKIIKYVKIKNTEYFIVQFLKSEFFVRIPDFLTWHKVHNNISFKNKSDNVRTLFKNIESLSRVYRKRLIFKGLGTKVNIVKNLLECKVGYSHLVKILIPEDLRVIRIKNTLIIEGQQAERVGNFSYILYNIKKHNDYKESGIRYKNEKIFTKAIKKKN